MAPFTRREVLAAATVGAVLPLASSATAATGQRRSMRIAHLTDQHVQPELGAVEGFDAAVRHARKKKPDFILTGGDLVMETLGASKERAQTEWDSFMSVVREHSDFRFEHTIGNHDVWGWGDWAKYSGEPKFGKAWACDVLGYERPYRSFDFAGWHIVVLDSTHKKEGNGYIARLDDEQFEWLQGDLAATDAKTPILVVSHIPIIAVCCFFDGENEKTGNWVIPGSWVHIDARRIKDLFAKHPNVKLCLSGHEHLVDSVSYNGVTYCCNGAVSGAWWQGDYHECTYGYGLVDLFDDGSFEVGYVPYGWKTRRG
jgi:3',5'-cyclic AMP phosphodiesterase CpdA